MLVHNIDPVIADLGIVSLRYYGLFLCMGIVCSFFVCEKFALAHGYDKDFFSRIVLVDLVCLFIFAHLVHMIFYDPHTLINDPIKIFDVRRGLASHGGFLGMIIGTYIMSRKYKLNFLELCDVFAVGGVIVVPFIRLGNFFNSEIYGRATDLPWGVVFQYRGETLPRHPSQIYELLIGVGVFVILFLIYRKHYRRVREGNMLFLFMMIYFLTRFFIEYVKEYQFLSPSFPLTMGQLLSIPMFLFAAFMFIRHKGYSFYPEPRPVVPINPMKKSRKKRRK